MNKAFITLETKSIVKGNELRLYDHHTFSNFSRVDVYWGLPFPFLLALEKSKHVTIISTSNFIWIRGSFIN